MKRRVLYLVPPTGNQRVYSTDKKEGPKEGPTEATSEKKEGTSSEEKKYYLADPKKYKTELCLQWLKNSGVCKYGSDCLYAHGYEELKYQLRKNNYKTEMCRWEAKGQKCRYGKRCHFFHSGDRFVKISDDLYMLYDTPPLKGHKIRPQLAQEGKKIACILKAHFARVFPQDVIPLIAEYADKYASWNQKETHGLFLSYLPIYSLPERFAVSIHDNSDLGQIYFGFGKDASHYGRIVFAHDGFTVGGGIPASFGVENENMHIWQCANTFEFEIIRDNGHLRVWPRHYGQCSVVLRFIDSYLGRSNGWDDLYFCTRIPPSCRIEFVAPID
jgi:hypothetical protein